jgi:hypothetical protein
VAAGLVSVALGQVVGRSVEFAHGEGVLTARDNSQARIAFRVQQHGDRPAEGTLRFTSALPDGRTVVIETSRLPRLEAREAGGQFAGPAVLVVSRSRRNDGFRWEGTVNVSVRNNVEITEGRDRRIIDIVEVSFTTDRTDRQYQFSGWTQPRNVDTGIRIGD